MCIGMCWAGAYTTPGVWAGIFSQVRAYPGGNTTSDGTIVEGSIALNHWIQGSFTSIMTGATWVEKSSGSNESKLYCGIFAQIKRKPEQDSIYNDGSLQLIIYEIATHIRIVYYGEVVLLKVLVLVITGYFRLLILLD